jgi:hypothetical protein
VNAAPGGGGDEVRPTGFLAEVLDENGVPLTNDAERRAFVQQLGLELIEFCGDWVAGHLGGDVPPTYARLSAPMSRAIRLCHSGLRN